MQCWQDLFCLPFQGEVAPAEPVPEGVSTSRGTVLTPSASLRSAPSPEGKEQDGHLPHPREVDGAVGDLCAPLLLPKVDGACRIRPEW